MPCVDKKIIKKIMPVFFIIKASDEMKEFKISTINEKISKFIDEFKDAFKTMSDLNADADVELGVLSFSSDASWITGNSLVPIQDFCWKDLEATGMANFGVAINEIKAKCKRSEFFASKRGYCCPIIIFVWDGYSTDDWQDVWTNAIGENPWFKIAYKIVIAVGNDVNMDAFKKITCPEAIIKVENIDSLLPLMRPISVHRDIIQEEPHIDTVNNTEISSNEGSIDNWDDDVWD